MGMEPQDAGEAGVDRALAAVGARLRQIRESRGLTVGDVEAATHIRAAYVEAIERGQAARLPAEVYLRGFLRNYAEFLGLNGAAVLQEYRGVPPGPPAGITKEEQPTPVDPDILSGALDPAEATGRAARRGTAGRVRRRQRSALPPLVPWAALVIVAGLTGWGSFTLAGRWLAARSAVPRAPAAQQVTPAPRVGQAGTAAASSATRGSTSAAGSLSSSSSSSSSTSAITSSQGSASATSPSKTSGSGAGLTVGVQVQEQSTAQGWLTTYTVSGAPQLQLRLQATGRCWTRRWVDGSSAYTDALLDPGTIVTWTAQRQLRVELGNTHVVLWVNGHRVLPLPPQNAYAEWVLVRRSPAR